MHLSFGSPWIDLPVFLVIIVIASEFLARSAEVLERRFGAGFVGSVILGFVTTFPELIFVLIAVHATTRGEVAEVAMGSAIGGNILLFTLGYGAVILFSWIYHRRRIVLSPYVRDDLWYLIISTAFIIFAVVIDRRFDLWEGIVLFAIYVVYVIHQFLEARTLQKRRREASEDAEENGEEAHPPPGRRDYIRSGVFLLIGAVGLFLAAEPLVKAFEGVSAELGISALVVATVLSPLASEMPEKISAFFLAKKSLKGAEVAVANFIGSKVQNNSLLFGLMIVYAQARGVTLFDPEDMELLRSLLFMVVTTAFGVKITYDLRLSMWEGALSLVIYGLIVAALFCPIPDELASVLNITGVSIASAVILIVFFLPSVLRRHKPPS
jgi:cation:H+ antiporter